MTGTQVSINKNPDGSPTDLVDRAEALSRVEGDRDLLASLVEIFMSEAGPMMAAIRSAVAETNADKLEKAAHRLKGSVSVFGAHVVTQAALDLEKIGRSQDLSNAAESLARLEPLMASFQTTLQQFCHELQS